MNFKLIMLFVFIASQEVFSQTSFDGFIEQYLHNEDIHNVEELIVDLHMLHENPININDDKLDDLLILPFISESDILLINEYILNNGEIQSIKELLLIKGFSLRKLDLIKMFISVKPKRMNTVFSRRFVKNGSYMGIAKIQGRYGGESKNKYKGDNLKQNYKLTYSFNNRIRAGIVAENDSGERFQFNNDKYGFDYYSAYVQLNSPNRLEQINIGDYTLSWGQGLVVSSSVFNSKSASTVDYGLGSVPIRKYSSTDENMFFRGLALKYRLNKNFAVIPILSINNIDARIGVDGVESIINTGFHRSNAEIAAKDAISEKICGIRTVWNNMRYQVACNYLNYSFSEEIINSKYSWKKCEFTGKNNFNLSLDYRLSLGHIFIFGESAISKNKAMAHILGINALGANNIKLTVIARSYADNYQSRFSNGFGESHHTSNEKGLYLGVEYTPSYNIKISAYYDYFSFPSEAYRMKNPGNGDEYLLNIDYKYSSTTNLIFRYKSEKKPHDIKLDKISNTLDVSKNSYRVSFKNHINSYFEISPRFEYTTYKYLNETESGFMIYCDFKYLSLSKVFKVQSRLAYYDTDSYNTRIFAYENDVLYAFSFPSYYYKGYRAYLNSSYRISKSVTFYAKVGYSYWKDRSNKQDVKFQLIMKI